MSYHSPISSVSSYSDDPSQETTHKNENVSNRMKGEILRTVILGNVCNPWTTTEWYQTRCKKPTKLLE